MRGKAIEKKKGTTEKKGGDSIRKRQAAIKVSCGRKKVLFEKR